jgi:hypothetical protein
MVGKGEDTVDGKTYMLSPQSTLLYTTHGYTSMEANKE